MTASMTDQRITAPKQSIEILGLYLVKEPEAMSSEQISTHTKGRQFAKFYEDGYRTKTPGGLEFIFQNSLGDDVVGSIIRSLIPSPRWGYLRLFSDILSSEHAWFFHLRDAKIEREEIHTLLVQFWIPGSSVVYYEGSHLQSFHTQDPENWGLLQTSVSNMEKEGIRRNEIDMPNGGYSIIDSRLGWTCRKGKLMNIGFGTDDEVASWARMELPNTNELKSKVYELEEAQGLKTHFVFI